MKEKIYIALAEDHALLREVLSRFLNDLPDLEVVFQARNGRELLAKLRTFKPSVVILDIEMPVAGGISTLEKIHAKYPDIRLMVLSVHSEITSVIEYVKRGALSFLPKHCSSSTLVEAIHTIASGKVYFEKTTFKELEALGVVPDPDGQRKKNERRHRLSQRDELVATHILNGYSINDLALSIGFSEKTAHWYVHKLMRKTGTKNYDELKQHLVARKNRMQSS